MPAQAIKWPKDICEDFYEHVFGKNTDEVALFLVDS